MKFTLYLFLLWALPCSVFAKSLHVGKTFQFKKIKDALPHLNNYDTLYIHEGLYKEGNVSIEKPMVIIGVNYPVLDGEKKYEVISVHSSNVTISKLNIIRSGVASLEDPCGIKIYDATNVTVSDNILDDNFFGIYLQRSRKCIVKNNKVKAYAKNESQMGNGIHCWRSDSLQIISNNIEGHRDGIYFEFVNASVIWRNTSLHNMRYGLHFMFSNDDTYVTNTFKNNGAGVAVMYSKRVSMFNNIFMENWGDAAYGLMLKELSDGYINGNRFVNNTYGVFMEGASRMIVEKNSFLSNGWGMTLQASCMDNTITQNNFIGNTFDMSTNGSLVLNTFTKNFWDKYEGYDLNKDGIGDTHYHPLSLFSLIVEKTPPAMILFRSFLVSLLDRSEKLIPSLTPDNFVDEKPLMKKLNI